VGDLPNVVQRQAVSRELNHRAAMIFVLRL
jgi:hypothetical protein